MTGELLDKKIISELVGERADILVFSEIDSTNTEAKRNIGLLGDLPIAFIAETQSAGRGRMGRSFYSPDRTGLYFSLLVKDKKQATESLFVTTAAAVAIRRAIKRVSGTDTGIKWINDLYLKDKKVAGILVEAVSLGEERYLVIGVGINLTTESFPDEIKDIAASLGVDGIRNRLAAECISELLQVLDDLSNARIIEEYRSASIVLGREIVYFSGEEKRVGIAKSIDERGRLTVIEKSGEIITLGSGEISIRFS